MGSFDYFTLTTASMDQDVFEIEMTKALEEIFTNLRQLKERRSQKRLSMDTDKSEEEDESHEHVERAENFETYPQEETQEKQDADIDTFQPQVPRTASETSLSSKDTDKNELGDEPFEHVERTFVENVETHPEKGPQEKQDTDVASVKPQVPQGQSTENRQPSKDTDGNELEAELFAHVETSGNVQNNLEKEPQENQNADVAPVKLQGPRRRQLPVLPVKKSL